MVSSADMKAATTETSSGAHSHYTLLNEPEPELAPLSSPIAILPEYITEKQTKILIEQHESTNGLTGRGYAIHDGSGTTFFNVKGDWSMSQRRTFEDNSGTVLFDLRRFLLSKKKHWYLQRPGIDNGKDGLMTANLRFDWILGLTLTVHNQVANGEQTVLEFNEIGLHGKIASLMRDGVEMAHFRRTSKDGSSANTFSERISFSKRPLLTVYVAQGMDLALVAAIGVISAELFDEYHFSIS